MGSASACCVGRSCVAARDGELVRIDILKGWAAGVLVK